MNHKNTLYIRFRNQDHSYEIYKSPVFTSPQALNDGVSDLSEQLDNFQVDGSKDGSVCVDADCEGFRSGNDAHIIWLMFHEFDQTWVDDLMKQWHSDIGFPLPAWDQWMKIDTIDEAYEA